MASSKRGHRHIDSENTQEQNSNGHDEASPLVHATQPRKRPRVSTAQSESPRSTPVVDDDGSSSSDDDVVENDDDDNNRADSPPQTQYEIMRDNGFTHLENPELDDELATQMINRTRSNFGENLIAESGIIESITCYNFMCHERLHVELGPLINFIVGENGSGKSAVLTALTLCLGGKASDTNRGGSLKAFIKEGRDQASLVVKIKNNGSDAYQPDIYGSSITVERHFSKTGSSGFKVKNDQDRIVSTKKQEIDEISEWFALQIGNPLTVLTQDNARQFLNSATPAQKYKYFISGVQLEQLDNDYKMSQDTLERTLILRDDLGEKIAFVEKEKDDALKLAETAQKNQSLREKLRLYRNQLAWYQVTEQEQELSARNADLVTRHQRILEKETECQQMTTTLQDVEVKLERVKAARESLNSEMDLVRDKTDAAEATYTAAKTELTDLHREERDAHARLKNMHADIKSFEAKIQEEENRLSESSGTERAEKDMELRRVSQNEKDLEEDLARQSAETQTLQSKITEAEQTLRKQQEIKELKRKEVLAAESAMRELEKSTGSPYDGFDREMMRIVSTISESDVFESKPLGPLGAHIKLLKPEWSGILEKTLGESLNAFVVRSKSDQSRLSALFRKLGLKKPPQIYISYGGRLDTSQQEPDASFDTILRVLEFDDDLVRSQLIINSQIEKVILVSERLEAERVMVDNNGPPRNVSACICFHDGKGKRGQGLRMTNRGGTIGTSPVIPTNQRPRMQTDSARQLTLQKENLKQLGLEMREVNNTERQVQQAVQKCKSGLQSHRENMKQTEVQIRHTQADIERISTELDAFEGVDGRLVLLRDELAGKQSEEEQLGSQYGNMKLAKVDLNKNAENAKKALGAARREAEAFEERVTKADVKINTHESLRRIAVSQKNAAFESLDIEKSESRRAESKRDQKEKEVEEFTNQAIEVAPDRVHIPDGETYEIIENKYAKIGEQLALRERRLGATDEQIYNRAEEARAQYEEVVQETQGVDDTISALKQAISYRLYRWRQFQRQISARIRIQFNYLLSERGFRGKIGFDHKGKKVVIQIEPDETRKSATGRDTKTLSGGEKSFSSICMLLSVWEAIGSPIRCLDEFDVFMDNVNRAISTNMLVDTARRSVSRQYILITPNAIEGRARLDKDVKVIRLTDPRQRRLI